MNLIRAEKCDMFVDRSSADKRNDNTDEISTFLRSFMTIHIFSCRLFFVFVHGIKLIKFPPPSH